MKMAEIREMWTKRVEDYRASGVKSRVAWCKTQGLSRQNLYYWEKKLRLQEAQPTATEQMHWVAATVDDCVCTDSSLAAPQNNVAVKIGNATIEVTPGFNKDLFATVVRVLVELC